MIIQKELEQIKEDLKLVNVDLEKGRRKEIY